MESVCSGRMATERRFIRLTELKSCSLNPIRHFLCFFQTLHALSCGSLLDAAPILLLPVEAVFAPYSKHSRKAMAGESNEQRDPSDVFAVFGSGGRVSCSISQLEDKTQAKEMASEAEEEKQKAIKIILHNDPNRGRVFHLFVVDSL